MSEYIAFMIPEDFIEVLIIAVHSPPYLLSVLGPALGSSLFLFLSESRDKESLFPQHGSKRNEDIS